jgi:hypothetical protein
VVDKLIAQRKDATIAGLVAQIDEKNARIRELEAERHKTFQPCPHDPTRVGAFWISATGFFSSGRAGGTGSHGGHGRRWGGGVGGGMVGCPWLRWFVLAFVVRMVVAVRSGPPTEILKFYEWPMNHPESTYSIVLHTVCTDYRFGTVSPLRTPRLGENGAGRCHRRRSR